MIASPSSNFGQDLFVLLDKDWERRIVLAVEVLVQVINILGLDNDTGILQGLCKCRTI
jgi:hypothetical protein